MGPQNGLIGDDFGTNLPEMVVPQKELMDERRRARFARSAEFKCQKAYFETRKKFYQSVLPDGRPVTAVDSAERANLWVLANAIIGEIQMFLNLYEQPDEALQGTDDA